MRQSDSDTIENCYLYRKVTRNKILGQNFSHKAIFATK